jgi:hypothetical protein
VSVSVETPRRTLLDESFVDVDGGEVGVQGSYYRRSNSVTDCNCK